MKASKKKKKQLLTELENNPLIERACKKADIARSTFYRWCGSDATFKTDAEAAIASGREKMNDFAESKLLEAINSGNLQGIRYWLDHNSKRYAGVSAAELKRLRFFETVVYELLDAAASKNDFAIVNLFAELRKQAEQQIEEERRRTEI